MMLGKGTGIRQVKSAECLDEKEPQRGSLSFDRARRKLAVTEQMHLVFADMLGPKLLRRTAEVDGELLHHMDIGPGSGRE